MRNAGTLAQDKGLVLRASLAVALAAPAGIAVAQVIAPPSEAASSAASDGKPKSPQTATLDTVTITANRRVERARDVAGSVNVLSGGRLDELGVQSLIEYAGFVPGLQIVAERPGFQQTSIRGITTGSVQTSATVGTYLDESPISFSSNFSGGAALSPEVDPFDLSRIEVLKGPQGSLYGASAMGGLIKYVTVAPNLQYLEGRAELGVDKISNGGTGYMARAAVSVPIVKDLLAVRAFVFSRKEAGYLDNIASGRDDINGYRNEGGRISVLFQPTRAFSARLTAETQKIKLADDALLQVDPTNLKPSYGDLKVAWSVPSPSVQLNNRANLTLNYDLGFANLLSVSSYLKVDQRGLFDYTDSLGSAFAVPVGGNALDYVFEYDNRKETQEFRLTSRSGGQVEWLGGVFYSYEKLRLPTAFNALKGPAGGPFTAAFANLLTIDQAATLHEGAAYGNATYKFTDAIDLQGGLRYSRITQTASQSNYTLFGSPLAADTSTDSSENHTTFLISPRWKLSTDQMIYARAASGYRPGGPNKLALAPNAPPSFATDKLINYEVGLKGAVPAARLQYAISLFRIDWKDIQVIGLDKTTGAGFFTNGGKAHSQGIELEGEYRPISPLRISGSLTAMQAKLDDDVSISGVNAKSGDDIPYVPRVSFALSADYSMPAFGGQATFGISDRLLGNRKSFYSNQKVGTGVQVTPADLPTYNLLDLRAALSRDIWTVSFFVKNVLDRRGALALNTYSVGPGATPGTTTPGSLAITQPRTFAVSVRADF